MWRDCMISIASAAMPYYALRLQEAECDWWAERMSEWIVEDMWLALKLDTIDREAAL